MKRRNKHGVESLILFMVTNCYCVQYFGQDTHSIKLMQMCMDTIIQIFIHMAVKEILTIKVFSVS